MSLILAINFRLDYSMGFQRVEREHLDKAAFDCEILSNIFALLADFCANVCISVDKFNHAVLFPVFVFVCIIRWPGERGVDCVQKTPCLS